MLHILKPDRILQVLELEHKLDSIQRSVSLCSDCHLVRGKLHVLREKVSILLNERRDQIRELAGSKYERVDAFFPSQLNWQMNFKLTFSAGKKYLRCF